MPLQAIPAGLLGRFAPLCFSQSASGEAQPYLPHVTPRVPRSVHAKFHADWSKTVGARGIHNTDGQTFLLYIDYSKMHGIILVQNHTKQSALKKESKLGFKIIAPFLNGPYSKNGVLFCKFSFLYLKVQLFSFKLT